MAITGLGIVSAAGSGAAAHLDALEAGRTALRPLTLFPGGELGARPVGEVDASIVRRGRGPRTVRLALHAARQAVAGRTLEGPGLLAVGTTTGGIFESEQTVLAPGEHDLGRLLHHPVGTVASAVGRALGLAGDQQTFATACSSSANAIGCAAAAVSRGVPWALAGGADSLARLTYTGFHSLKLLSTAPCRPFDRRRNGLSLGEGAGFILLEDAEGARRRGTPILGAVLGWGCASDAYHPTAPHPEGTGAVAAIEGALLDAGLPAAAIDHVNAHGTATPANDLAEGLALERVFGATHPPVSSTKGLTGHTLGAAGAIEAILALLSLSSGFLPATIGLEEPDPQIHIAHVPPGGAWQQISTVLSSSFGFGGNNAALILSREPR